MLGPGRILSISFLFYSLGLGFWGVRSCDLPAPHRNGGAVFCCPTPDLGLGFRFLFLDPIQSNQPLLILAFLELKLHLES
jgi:hypothetical protein